VVITTVGTGPTLVDGTVEIFEVGTFVGTKVYGRITMLGWFGTVITLEVGKLVGKTEVGTITGDAILVEITIGGIAVVIFEVGTVTTALVGTLVGTKVAGIITIDE